MTHAILKKLKPLAAALAVAALLVAPVRPAQAWDEVCMWQEPGEERGGASFPAHMVVIHGFEPGPGGEIPTRIHAGIYRGNNAAERAFHRRNPEAWKWADQESDGTDPKLRRKSGGMTGLPSILDKIHNSDEVRGAFDESLPPARGLVEAALLGGKTGCASIRHLRPGEPFYVMVKVHDKRGRDHVVCGVHSSNRNWWYPQRNRPYSNIVWHFGGSVAEPRCWYHREQ